MIVLSNQIQWIPLAVCQQIGQRAIASHRLQSYFFIDRTYSANGPSRFAFVPHRTHLWFGWLFHLQQLNESLQSHLYPARWFFRALGWRDKYGASNVFI